MFRTLYKERGEGVPSVLSELLEESADKEGRELAEEHEIAKNVSVTAFEGKWRHFFILF